MMPVGFSKAHKVNGYSLYMKKQKQKIKKEKKKDGSDGQATISVKSPLFICVDRAELSVVLT